MSALANAWRWYLSSLEEIGQSIEAVPGWGHVEGWLDAVADGLVFMLALIWALRWFVAAAVFGILVVGST